MTSRLSPRWFLFSNFPIYVNLISMAVYVSHAPVDSILQRMNLFQHFLRSRQEEAMNSLHLRLLYLNWQRIVTYGLVFAALLLLARRVEAHQGGLFTPSDLWTHWKWNFGLVVSLFVSTWFYTYSVSALR